MIQDLKHLGLVVCFWLGMVSLAQGQAGSLHGGVMDPSGAVVPGAAVTLNGNGQTLNTTSGPDGRYAFRGLASAAACRSRAARFRRRWQPTARSSFRPCSRSESLDRFTGFDMPYENRSIREARDMAQLRRKIHDLMEARQSPIATEAVKRITIADPSLTV